MLYVRFPYLSTYYEISDKDILHTLDGWCSTKCESLEQELQWMAYGCAAPSDNALSVSRLVDHLGETTKLGRMLQIANTTGPGGNLPDGQLVSRYCMLALMTLSIRHAHPVIHLSETLGLNSPHCVSRPSPSATLSCRTDKSILSNLMSRLTTSGDLCAELLFITYQSVITTIQFAPFVVPEMTWIGKVSIFLFRRF